MLIDPGEDIYLISDEFCKKARIRTTAAPYKVQLANKSTENMRVARNRIIVSLGGYTGSFGIAANSLKYDVILGKKWCAKHKAKIDCEKKHRQNPPRT